LNYTGDLQYNFKQFLKDDQTEEELMRVSPVSYCLMQCHKICYYCKLLWRWEIVRMQVEFHTDYSG
jgi:hypothetical protein